MLAMAWGVCCSKSQRVKINNRGYPGKLMIWLIMKLKIHCEAAPDVTPISRMQEGKISPR